MIDRIKISSIIILFMILYSSCSVTRTLEDDELLYTKTKIDLEEKSFFEKRGLEKELEKAAVPEPNDEFLGFIPFQLWMYNLAGDSVPDKGLRHWLKYKVGQEPVVYNEGHKENSINNITAVLFNKGYFD